MPVWKIYHSPNVFTDQDKATIAKGATDFYVGVDLPAFYVHVFFLPLEKEDNYTAGTQQDRFVFIELDHIARNVGPDWGKWRTDRLKNAVDSVMMPFTTHKGIHLEYCVLEGPAALWRIDGVDPPEAVGPDERAQAEENRRVLAERYGTVSH